MLKQSVSRIKKVLHVLLAVLFVVSLTAVSASAHYYNHRYGFGGAYPYPWAYYPSVAYVGDGLASPLMLTDAAVPAVTAAAAPAVTTSTATASPLVVASAPGILSAPPLPVFGYGLYSGLGYGGCGCGGHHGYHHR